ncbi:MAG TPA: hypothetical protein VKM94_18360 [Blastocatellia bacterium]|nr:hypothetical protein [Blastocatellia bacterium]
MRQSFLLLSLILVCEVGRAQTRLDAPPNDRASRPVPRNQRFVLSDIDEKIVKQFKGAWQQSGLGTKDSEAVVFVVRKADGSVDAVWGGCTNESYKFTFHWNPSIIAIVHTHPNSRDPKPQEQDLLVAQRFGVPILTITRRGMYIYDPSLDRIKKVHNGTDWLEISSWTRKSPSTVARLSNKE